MTNGLFSVIVGKLSWWSLRKLACVGLGWAENKVVNEIQNRITIEKRGNASIHDKYPLMTLVVRVNNNSDVDVYFKQIIAWIRIYPRDAALPKGTIREEDELLSIPIDKVSWYEQDHTGLLVRPDSDAGQSDINASSVYAEKKLLAQKASYAEILHTIPPYVDFSLHNFVLEGVMEFAIKNIGTFSKRFTTHFDISNEWTDLQTSKDGWESFLGTQSLVNWLAKN